MTAITPERFKVFEDAVQAECEQLGWHVQPQGMGTYTPEIAKTLAGKTGLAAHFPDLLVARNGVAAWIEVKNTTPRHRTSSNYCIELASLKACIDIEGLNENVAIVWHDGNCHWPSEVVAAGVYAGTSYDPQSSQDPFGLVARDSLPTRTLADWLAVLW